MEYIANIIEDAGIIFIIFAVICFVLFLIKYISKRKIDSDFETSYSFHIVLEQKIKELKHLDSLYENKKITKEDYYTLHKKIIDDI